MRNPDHDSPTSGRLVASEASCGPRQVLGAAAAKTGGVFRACTIATVAALSLFSPGVALAQAAPAASQAEPGVIATPLPQAPSQRMTVEDLLRNDAESALSKIKPAAPTPSPSSPPDGVGPGSVPAKPASFAPVVPSEPVTIIQVDSIYGTHSQESDSRVVEATINGVAKTLRPGDLYAGMRLISIRGDCASFAKETSSTSAKATTNESGKRSAKPPKPNAVPATPAVRAKPREVCISSPYGSDGGNALTLPRIGGMPSPVYSPMPAPSVTLGAPLIPGQPMYPPPGTVSTGSLPIGPGMPGGPAR